MVRRLTLHRCLGSCACAGRPLALGHCLLGRLGWHRRLLLLLGLPGTELGQVLGAAVLPIVAALQVVWASVSLEEHRSIQLCTSGKSDGLE